MQYLLDTNAWVSHFRGFPQLSTHLQNNLTQGVCLCCVVLAELCYGAFHGDPQLLQYNLNLIQGLQQDFSSLAFDDVAAVIAAEIRHELAALGTPIGSNDLLITAFARANHLTLVAHNTREFGRIPNLLIEDWQS